MATTTKHAWHTGHALQQLIGEGRKTIEEAASGFGVSAATFYRYFQQERLPDRIVRRLAEHFGVAHEWLASGRGERVASPTLAAVSIERQIERMLRAYHRAVERETRTLAAKIVKATSALDIFVEDDD